MDINDFRVVIASLPNRESLVAEIYYKGNQWAEVSQECEELVIQFYSPSNSDYWEFPFDLVMQVLEKAKNKLLYVV